MWYKYCEDTTPNTGDVGCTGAGKTGACKQVRGKPISLNTDSSDCHMCQHTDLCNGPPLTTTSTTTTTTTTTTETEAPLTECNLDAASAAVRGKHLSNLGSIVVDVIEAVAMQLLFVYVTAY